jgi:hypothetical protein
VAELILGPLLRYVGEREATVWVETDAPCQVEVLGHRAQTLHVAGHHYALVAIGGLERGQSREYDVVLDGERRWPEPQSALPPSRIGTLHPDDELSIAFGSCRVAAPHSPPYNLEPREHPLGLGVDALRALARRVAEQPSAQRPSLLLMVGDQVYADHVSPGTREFMASRRSLEEPPGEQIADFEEYTRLYREAWREPLIRWLLSTVPSAMVFDDHEVIDDWNISAAWKAMVRREPWWRARIAGAFMAYWLYQHLGNLSPEQLRQDELLQRARAADDAAPVLEEFALHADRTTAGKRWSFSRELGRSRLVVIDSRAGRVLSNGRREMLDEEEWRWLEDELRGVTDHLLLATSLPFLLPRSIHDVERWNEAVCAGAWGWAASKLGERLRRAIDLEHWASFALSFDRLAGRLGELWDGTRQDAPASIILLSGDVHYAYLAEATFPTPSARTRLWQVVCSPLRHSLDPALRHANRAAFTRAAAAVSRLLARAARLSDPTLSWEMTHGPDFDNQITTIALRGRRAYLTLERTPPRQLRLEPLLQARLA